MKRQIKPYFHIIFLVIITLQSTYLFSQELIKNATIDISKINLDEEILYLNGSWKFYDNKLYTPNDFAKGNITKSELIKVPGLWNKLLKNNGQGYGTYKLIISSLKKDELYAININRIQSSYKLWINGKLYKENGVVGIDKEHSKPRWSSEDIIFIAKKNSADIVIQVSNFYHKKGGIENSIAFGKAENIIEHTWNISALDFFLLGALLIMTAYHFAMFFFRKNDKSNLYFALTLVFTALFTLTVGEILIVMLFPNIPWQLLLKFNHSSNYWRLVFFTLFIYISFKEYMNKYIIKGIIAISLLAIVLILVTPAIIFTKFLIIYIILVAISLIYMITGQIRALINRKAGALFSLMGVSVLLITGINDILNELQIINSINLSTFGFFIFIIFHSYLISIQNSKAYRTIKKITNDLLIRGKIKDALFSAKKYKLDVPLKAITKVIDADKAIIFILKDNEWVATDEFNNKEDMLTSLNLKMFSIKEDVYFSDRSVKKAISTNKINFTKETDNLKANEIVYFKEKNIKSILTFPLIKDEKVFSILYFENYSKKEGFSSFSKELIQSIMPQIITFSENVSSYDELTKFNISLEEKVETVKTEITIRNQELKSLRDITEEQNEKASELSYKLEIQNQEIKDGIQYAKKIQASFSPKKDLINSVFPNNFIFNKSKDILGGDFLWLRKLSDTESIFVVADSTGHGVSGALMSIIGHELLNDAVIYNKNYSPKKILNYIQKEFTEHISKNQEIGGIDLSVIYYNSEKQELRFSAAQNSIYIVQNGNLIEYRGTAISIGNQLLENEIKKNTYFTNRRINISKGDILYMFTDGFIDQVGHESQRKFMKTKFKELISSIQHEEPENQKKILEQTFENWKGKESQTDDILITGILF